jgi:hypothetical protein
MFFLLRLGFWLLLIFLLLPSNPEDNQKIIKSAEKTVDDLRGFCERNPDVCASARDATGALLKKVQDSAGMVQQWIETSQSEGEDRDGAQGKLNQNRLPQSSMQPSIKSQNAPPVQVNPNWQSNTLTLDDRHVPWRGPGSS